jgi:hypothetical protein
MRYIPSGHVRGPSMGYRAPLKRRWRRMVGLGLLAVLALSVAGCGAAAERRHTCEAEIGPQPYEAANGFGLIGVFVLLSQPEFIAWGHKIDECTARLKAVDARSVR